MSPTDETNHFTVGPVVLFISSQISEDISFYTEAEWDFSEDGSGKLDVERVMLNYAFAPWLNIAAGRGHTALGAAHVLAAVLCQRGEPQKVISDGGPRSLRRVLQPRAAARSHSGKWEREPSLRKPAQRSQKI